MARTPLIAANWKMYKTLPQTRAFFEIWRAGGPIEGREVTFFPPATLLHEVASLLARGESVGAQNVHEAAEGAFTGELSCAMLTDAKCHFVLIGHSERRHVFGEPDSRLALKVKAALAAGLRPILCVGERLEEREAGQTLEVVLGQLEAGLGPEVPKTGFDIAYEPVWAIGTGKVASCQDALEVHTAIRAWLDRWGAGEETRILYGGSVKPDNASELLKTPGVEGLLVGGASLDPKTFRAIAEAK